MAYTFLRAQGRSTGTSLVEPERVDDARRVLEAAEAAGRRLLLPTDHLVAERLAPDAPVEVREEIPDGWLGVDIGPATAAAYAAEAGRARTIFWNGPMGVFEMEPFAGGTEAVGRAVANSPARSVVGGGDSVAAINRLGLGDRIGHLSTGGGASLEYVQGLELPGVAALEA
jgi:phosphoglycerate kinase